MLCSGRLNAPSRHAGLRPPSYSNLDSMSWMEEIFEGSRGAAPRIVRARNTGTNELNGSETVCHSPAGRRAAQAEGRSCRQPG